MKISGFDMEIDINNIGITLSIFRIGSVYSVDGRTIRIKVDKIKNSSHLIYRGCLLYTSDAADE